MKSLLILLVVLVCMCSIASLAYAQELHLALYPPIIEIVTTSDTTHTAPITLTNLSTQSQTVTASFKAFRPQGEDGTIAFTDDNRNDSIFVLVQDGKAIAESLDLRPNEKRELTLIVKVPQEASDIYTTLLLQTKNTTKSSQTVSKIETGIGTNIIVSIRNPSGTASVSAGLKEFSMPVVLFDQPPKPTLRIENKGKHFIKTRGEITIFDREDNEVKKIHLPMQNILALSTRDLSSQLEPLSTSRLFGKYRVEARVDLGEGKILSDGLIFYAAPKKIGIILILILLALGLVIIRVWAYARKISTEKMRKRTKSKIDSRKGKKTRLQSKSKIKF